MWPYVSAGGGRSIRDRGAAAHGLGQNIMTPAALTALQRVANAAQTALRAVTAPTLVIHSTGDNRISPAHAQRDFDRLAARDKKLIWMEGAGHVITVDYGHETVFELTAQWLRTHGAAAPESSESAVRT
jgi:esterase/lipase